MIAEYIDMIVQYSGLDITQLLLSAILSVIVIKGVLS